MVLIQPKCNFFIERSVLQFEKILFTGSQKEKYFLHHWTLIIFIRNWDWLLFASLWQWCKWSFNLHHCSKWIISVGNNSPKVLDSELILMWLRPTTPTDVTIYQHHEVFKYWNLANSADFLYFQVEGMTTTIGILLYIYY